MTVSRKTLTIAESLFQDEIKLELDVIKPKSVTILEVLSANKISINQSCGGHGTCGTCRIFIKEPSNFLCEPSHYEIEASKDLQLQAGQRLACQTEINYNSSLQNLEIKIVHSAVE
jgi:2Fe-2S ferredoxin